MRRPYREPNGFSRMREARKGCVCLGYVQVADAWSATTGFVCTTCHRRFFSVNDGVLRSQTSWTKELNDARKRHKSGREWWK